MLRWHRAPEHQRGVAHTALACYAACADISTEQLLPLALGTLSVLCFLPAGAGLAPAKRRQQAERRGPDHGSPALSVHPTACSASSLHSAPLEQLQAAKRRQLALLQAGKKLDAWRWSTGERADKPCRTHSRLGALLAA